MKKIVSFLCVIFIFTSLSFADADKWTQQENEWIKENRGKTFYLGISTFFGKSYFVLNDEEKGYIFNVAKLIEKELGIKIEVVADYSWNIVFNKLKNGNSDLLFGANTTKERLEFMSFTEPIVCNPYAVLTLKESKIKTLSDLDKHKVGFFKSDVAIDLFLKNYNKINVNIATYESHPEIIQALISGEIDAFITQAGGIETEFLLKYPQIKKVTNLNNVHSDMTISAFKKNKMLIQLIDKILKKNRKKTNSYITEANIYYNYKLLNFTKEEVKWIQENGSATVAVVNNYLPFDYYSNGKYLGIAGQIFEELEQNFGLSFEYAVGEFDELYTLATEGKIDIINVAKSKEREKYFIFTDPIAEEIDVIYGNTNASYINDIYGLEGKTIAVVDGFWHLELLEKNLTDIKIISTKNIATSINLVSSNKADYFIENPTVAKFYIEGLGYNNIEKKGMTTSDSFIYLGINKNKKILASIINKSLCLIDYQSAKEKGIKSIPKLLSNSVKKLTWGIIILAFIIIVIAYILYEVVKSLIQAHETTAVLREREKLMYVDSLTSLKNRMYYNSILKDLEANTTLGLIILDLNDFKKINDNYGHLFGDLYLTAFADRLQLDFKDDICIRMGGDEFLVLIKNPDEQALSDTIKRFKHNLKNTVIEYNNKSIVGINVAIGSVIRESHCCSLEEAFIIADDRMYHNKKSLKSEDIF